ncbi:MAG TPA: redox-sensing transcriptional repressor Rex [Gemmatimonadaceae bacterium]|nr:redox-sensing transcriptional repressor Rex [Gemmatimonadaceae bacterium]
MKRIAESSVRRLSLYLRYLEDFTQRGQQTISSEELARCGGTTSAQVRKDLSFFGSFGKRGLGYAVPELAARLRDILGIGRQWRIVIIGAGNIGVALARYRGFRDRGFTLVGLFDSDPARVGRKADGLHIRDMARFERDVKTLKPHIAVITVPADAAQTVVERVTKAGLRAILNFAPIGVQVPDDVALRNVNMAIELEVLAYALKAE